MTTSHADIVNGFTTSEFRAIDDLSVGETIANLLSRMDGIEFHSWLLWRLPPGKSLEQIIRKVASKKEPSRFMQCAGSSPAMTVELREPVGPAGALTLLTVGKPTQLTTGLDRVAIPWSEHVVSVRPNEAQRGARGRGSCRTVC